MNLLDFSNKSAGWPGSASTFEFMQQQLLLLQNISLLGGNLFILNGCNEVSGNVSNGRVIINGEILDFVGGAVQSHVVIVENVTNKLFFDAQIKPYYRNRYATFGTAATQYAWASFERNNPADGLLKRMKVAEELAQTLVTNLAALTNSFNTHTHSWESITGKPNFYPVYGGTVNIGDVTTADMLVSVPIPNQGTNNYIVTGTLVGLSNNHAVDNDVTFIVYNKTANQFQISIREFESVVQNLRFEFVIFKP